MSNQPEIALPRVSFETNPTGFLSGGIGVHFEGKKLYCRVHDVIIASANRHCARRGIEQWDFEKRPPFEGPRRG